MSLGRRLRSIGDGEAERIRSTQEHVLGIAIGGSVGRGDYWPGSDVDIYVLQSTHTQRPRKTMSIKHGTLVDTTTLSEESLEDLTSPERRLTEYCESSLPDELHQCTIMHDPEGVLTRFTEFNEANLLDPAVVRVKYQGQVGKAAAHLAEAERLCSFGLLRQGTIQMRESVHEMAKAKMVIAEGFRKGLKTVPDRIKSTLGREFCKLHSEIWRTGMTRQGAQSFLAEYYDLMYRQHISFLKELWPKATEEWREKKGWRTPHDLDSKIQGSREYNDLVYGRPIESGRLDSGVVLVRSFLSYFPRWNLVDTYYESQGLKSPETIDIDSMEKWPHLPGDVLETYLHLQDFATEHKDLIPSLRQELTKCGVSPNRL